MTTFYDNIPPYIVADVDKVLCNGYTKTSLGGRVYCATVPIVDWEEMTEAEADALIAANSEVEATEADYQASLTELGVTFNEEN